MSVYLDMYRTGKRTPTGFWMGPEGLLRGKMLVRFGVRHIVGLNARSDIVVRFDRQMFLDTLKLGGFWKYIHTVYHAIDGAFPELGIMPWELRHTSHGFWSRDYSALAALRWFIDRQGWTPQECYRQLRSNAEMVYTQLRDSGLGELVKDRRIFGLLHTIDSSIDPQSTSMARHESKIKRLKNERKQKPPSGPRRHVPIVAGNKGIYVAVEQWADVRWVALDMEEWSESLEIKPIPSTSLGSYVRVKVYKPTRTNYLISLPTKIMREVRTDIIIRAVGKDSIALRFRDERSRSIVWNYLQRRRSHRREERSAITRRMWANPEHRAKVIAGHKAAWARRKAQC